MIRPTMTGRLRGRSTRLMIVALAVLSIQCLVLPVLAADVHEPNDTPETATTIEVKRTYSCELLWPDNDCFNFTWADEGVGIKVYFNVHGDGVDNIDVRLFNSTMDQVYLSIISKYDDNQVADVGVFTAGAYCLQLQSHMSYITTLVEFNVGAPLPAAIDPLIIVIVVIAAAACTIAFVYYWIKIRPKRSRK